MKLLAIDPGPERFGWAVLATEGARTTHVTSGWRPSTPAAFTALAFEHFDGGWPPGLVVEMPQGPVFQPFRGPYLLATTRVAGGMSWLASYYGTQVVELSAQQVRKVLCGKANADDHAVADAVRTNVIAAPAKASDHAYDAIAAGLVGAWVMAGRIARPVAAVKTVTRARRPVKRRAAA